MSIAEPSNTGWCNLCPGPVETDHLLDHIRNLHPAQYGAGPERWPDGGLAVVDTTLTPDEFGDSL